LNDFFADLDWRVNGWFTKGPEKRVERAFLWREERDLWGGAAVGRLGRVEVEEGDEVMRRSAVISF